MCSRIQKYYIFGENKERAGLRAYWAGSRAEERIKGREERTIPNSGWCCAPWSSFCDHPPPEEIFDKAAPEECPGLSLGTVYRNLNSLVEAGMVRRVSIPGRADRFDHTLCWHSHLYCTACGGVVDADVDENR